MSAAAADPFQLESHQTPAHIEPVRLVQDPTPAALEAELDRVARELAAVQNELAELRARDAALRSHTHRLDEELKLAARVQQDFLPKSLPQVGRVRFHVIFRPAGFVSGDLYDVMRLDETNVGVYMADAVGHGMPAALLTMFLKQALVTKEILASGYRLLSPGVAMERLNDALVAQNLSQATFATAAYATIDTRGAVLTLARGGHPAPIRLTRTHEVQELEAEGSLLGIFPNEKFAETTVQLEPGDRVFLYSDGVEVSFGGDATQDTNLWRQQVMARRELATSAMVSELTALVDATGTPLKDDLTMIVLEVE